MSDTRELLRRCVEGFEPMPDAMERVLRRRDRKRRNQRIAAGVVGIAVFVAAVWALGIRVGQDATAPADRPTQDTPTPADNPTGTVDGKTAEDVARDFVNETAFFETDLAVRHLVDASLVPSDAAVSGLGLDGIEEFRRWLSFNQATGFEIIPGSCKETDSSNLGTSVHCTFDFHGIRSEAIGRGPYSGSYFDILVAHHVVEYGRILDVSAHLETAFFGPEMWDPFAEWVSTTYPQDAAVMYTNANLTDYRLTPRSILLWKKHTREYVETGRVAAQPTGAVDSEFRGWYRVIGSCSYHPQFRDRVQVLYVSEAVRYLAHTDPMWRGRLRYMPGESYPWQGHTTIRYELLYRPRTDTAVGYRYGINDTRWCVRLIPID